MEHPGSIEADRSRPRLGRVALASAPIVMIAYALTLAVANRLGAFDALAAGAANAVPVLLFGMAAYLIVRDRIAGRAPVLQVAAHLALAAVFALLAYWLLVVLLGLLQGVSATEFDVRPFPDRAMAWQLLQNVTTYGIVATLAHLDARVASPVAHLLEPGAPAEDERERPFSRYFIRTGDDLRPIDVDEIVSISGADDYAEVSTTAGRHLVRMTLAEFERALDPGRFIRVHRSRIVNLARIARAEPAGGGRMLLHMEDGEMIQASRAGSRLLRDRVI